MATQPIRIVSKPGVKRDGTRLEGDNYVDGKWMRFDRGLPRKIGGCRSINRFLTGPPRTINTYTRDDLVYVHFGSATKVERLTSDASFNTSAVSNRTPAGLIANPDNLWQFDVDHAAAGGPLLVAQVAPNLRMITNSTEGQLFTGPLFATTPLVPIPGANLPVPVSMTGGIFALHPYTIVFGNAGFIMWSVPGNAADYTGSGSGNAFVARQKLLYGLPLRGGGSNSPSALLWSADALLRMTYVGGSVDFAFDTLSSQSSILSQFSVIEYDGIFYWVGIDRFLMFNGVIREVENTLNKNFFFDNINWAHRQKVFVTKVPRFGEIWWCFPRYPSTEPNWAVIYNVRENTWYDTPLPAEGRSAGVFPTVFRWNVMTGVTPQSFFASAASVQTGGAGYAVDNELTVVGGVFSTATKLKVLTVAAGQVTSVSVIEAGTYTVPPPNPVAVTGGGGVGATFNLTSTAPYKLWIHEIGTDEVDETNTRPLESYFETGDISLPVQSSTDKTTRVLLVEPDFVQKGDMTLQVKGRANARAPDVFGPVMTFPEVAATPEQQVVYLKDQRRELRFRFGSNVVGGDYQMGLVLAHLGPGDGTVLG